MICAEQVAMMESPSTTTTTTTTTTCPYSARKRPPKGLRRACWECKKRKTTGSSSQTDTSTLNGLELGRGGQDSTCSIHLSERLGKLEQLFERFVCRKTPTVEPSVGSSQSASVIGSNEKDLKHSLPLVPEDPGFVKPFGGGLLGSHLWTSPTSTHTLVDHQDEVSNQSADAVHQSLVALLPSQHDADIIFESSNGWMILEGIYRASEDLYVNRDRQSYALDMAAIAQERSIIVARTLLHLAVCINSLPPEFEQSCLSNMWCLDAAMQNYVTTVTSLITSSDEQMLTLHGLETLLLLAVYHMNSANLRQAWLIVRRGLNLAHLMGFHRIIVQPGVNPPIAAVSNAKAIWRTLVDMDRYLGLHLRLPFASEDYPLPEDADLHLIHKSKINTLSRQVAELDCNVSPQTYATALALDEKLESMVKEMPKEFWEVPNIPSTAKSPESFAVLERLMVQMWHFEMKVFIHLPYLLRASKEGRYEYSKVTALQASRSMLMRWFALRNAGITQACCRFAEIGVFFAAITLTLDIVIELGTKEKLEVQKTKGTDFAMLCRLIGEMEKLAKTSTREKIAARSAIVLKKILTSLDPSKQPAGTARLTIPFFGTVELQYGKVPLRSAFDIDSETGRKMMNTTATGPHLPVFSFVSNALWPSVREDGDCEELDWDIVLFDGLEDMDTEGNWVF